MRLARIARRGAVSRGLVVAGLLVIGGCKDVAPASTAALPSAESSPSAAAGAPPSTAPKTSIDPSPTIDPGPATSPAPSVALAPGIAADDIVRSNVDRLRVRTAPGLDAAPITGAGTAGRGTAMFLASGPVSADGYDWFFVMPLDVGPTGWAAAADRDGTPWLVPWARPCPKPPLDRQDALDLSTFGGLACFGASEVRFVGDARCDLVAVDRVFSGPDWLRSDRRCDLELGGGQAIEIFDADLDAGHLYRQITFIGHFDDPQAATCHWAAEPPAPDPIAVVASCRSMFVATEAIVGP